MLYLIILILEYCCKKFRIKVMIKLKVNLVPHLKNGLFTFRLLKKLIAYMIDYFVL